jgi:hypothetical protein
LDPTSSCGAMQPPRASDYVGQASRRYRRLYFFAPLADEALAKSALREFFFDPLFHRALA